jgi:hypothetical protein
MHNVNYVKSAHYVLITDGEFRINVEATLHPHGSNRSLNLTFTLYIPILSSGEVVCFLLCLLPLIYFFKFHYCPQRLMAEVAGGYIAFRNAAHSTHITVQLPGGARHVKKRKLLNSRAFGKRGTEPYIVFLF